MMLEVVRFSAIHSLQIRKQPQQELELGDIPFHYYVAAQALPHSYTILIDGKPMACVGVADKWYGRGECWALIDNYSGKHFVSIIRAMKRILDIITTERLEMTVQRDFKQAHRLAKLLGFELEADCMRKYGVTGLDYSLYARVK
jgi:hypothetical protein